MWGVIQMKAWSLMHPVIRAFAHGTCPPNEIRVTYCMAFFKLSFISSPWLRFFSFSAGRSEREYRPSTCLQPCPGGLQWQKTLSDLYPEYFIKFICLVSRHSDCLFPFCDLTTSIISLWSVDSRIKGLLLKKACVSVWEQNGWPWHVMTVCHFVAFDTNHTH